MGIKRFRRRGRGERQNRKWFFWCSLRPLRLGELCVESGLTAYEHIRPTSFRHFFSSHGFGHLAQVAPILNELATRLPERRLTIRCGLPLDKLRARIGAEFTHIAGRTDFGFVMLDAVSIDLSATAQAYRAQHADWAQRVANEQRLH